MGDPDRRAAERADNRRARLNRHLRQSFIDGVEVDARRLVGRGLVVEELVRMLRRYPGDVADRQREQSMKSITSGARQIEAAVEARDS